MLIYTQGHYQLDEMTMFALTLIPCFKFEFHFI